MNSGGSRSGRVDRIWPSLANVGPSSSSAERRRLAWRCRPTAPSSSGRPNSSFSPCLANTAAMWLPARHQPGLGLVQVGGAAADRRARPDGGRLHGGAAVGRRGVHDDHRASRVVADPVGDVAQQELLAARHAGVAHDEHVDVVFLGRLDDRHGRIVVHHDVRLAAVAGHLSRVDAEVVGRAGGAGGFGCAVLRAAGVRRQHHLHDVELGAERVGERRRPAHGSLGRLGPVGADHDAIDGTGDLRFGCAHGRIMAVRGPARQGSRPVQLAAQTRTCGGVPASPGRTPLVDSPEPAGVAQG